MRDLPAALAAHLGTGTTTLCWCWRLARRDGVRVGFTDHDRDLAFDGTSFEAAAGMTASEIRESAGLGVDNLEIEGALTSDHLTEADLAAGLFDEAEVEIWRVNWQDVEQRVMMKTGTLGEIRRSGPSFAAEVRGLAHKLQRPTGRLFQYTCDADLGDRRCGVTLAAPALTADGTVSGIPGTSELAVAGLAAYGDGWFTRGLLALTSGEGAGFRVEVRIHRQTDTGARLALWQPLPAGVTAGDGVRVIAGCDKLPVTCAAKFANIVNFRGFPHMPGNDYVTAIARPGATVRGSAAS